VIYTVLSIYITRKRETCFSGQSLVIAILLHILA